MSRTDKDRPYWVRLNDKTEATVEIHCHTRLGYRNEFISPRSGKVVVIEYPDYCTINEPEPNPHVKTDIRQPCGKILGHGSRFGYRRGPKKEDRHVYYWGPLRSARKDYLTKAVKDYNSFGEVDEDFYLQEDARYGRYGGGYWD